jgi:hypothetical protein
MTYNKNERLLMIMQVKENKTDLGKVELQLGDVIIYKETNSPYIIVAFNKFGENAQYIAKSFDGAGGAFGAFNSLGDLNDAFNVPACRRRYSYYPSSEYELILQKRG